MISAFISYQTSEKNIATKVSAALSAVNISSFMANENIQVSEEWKLKILQEISSCNIFICILSKEYMQSAWCLQESGIAAIRTNMTVIPLSIDGTIAPGFISNFQSIRIDPDNISITDLIPGLAKQDFNFSFGIMLDRLASTRSFRSAEAEFKIVLPYINRMSIQQKLQLLKTSIENRQILHADLCTHQYLPPLARECSHLLNPHELEALNRVMQQD